MIQCKTKGSSGLILFHEDIAASGFLLHNHSVFLGKLTVTQYEEQYQITSIKPLQHMENAKLHMS